jgi:hypothetical protein
LTNIILRLHGETEKEQSETDVKKREKYEDRNNLMGL